MLLPMSRLIPHFNIAPTAHDLETIAQTAFAEIPEILRHCASDVVIRIEEFPDDEIITEMELETPYEVLGLYHGVALTERSIMDMATMGLDMIYLYRRPILDYWCETGEDLTAIVKHVLIHEIGHHFGFSDEDMDRIEDEAEDDDIVSFDGIPDSNVKN